MNFRQLKSTLDIIESNSGMQQCLYLNETTKTVDNIIYGPDFMNILHTIMLLSGLIITCYGNKIVKPVIFVTGAVLGGYIGAYASMFYSKLFSIECNTLYIISGVVSIICASLALSIYRIANMLLGMSIGSSVGYFIYNLGLYNINIGHFLGHNTMYWCCIGIPAIVCAYICNNKNQEILIYLSPAPGSLMFLYSVDALLISNISGDSSFTKLEWNYDNLSHYLYALVWIIMTLFGVVVQKRGYVFRFCHKESEYSKNKYKKLQEYK